MEKVGQIAEQSAMIELLMILMNRVRGKASSFLSKATFTALESKISILFLFQVYFLKNYFFLFFRKKIFYIYCEKDIQWRMISK